MLPRVPRRPYVANVILRPTTLLIAASLAATLLVPGSATAVAPRTTHRTVAKQVRHKPPKKKVVHKYQVTYVLSGHLDVETTYVDDSEGFCPGTGFTEHADFATRANYVVKLTVGKAGQIKAEPGIQDDPQGTWSASGKQVADGDDCGTTSTTACNGALDLTQTGSTTLFAQTTKKSATFQTSFYGLPNEANVASDCRQTEAYYPVLDYGLFRALRPWNSVPLSLKWKKLKKLAVGKSITTMVRYKQAPDGYALSTCDKSPPCIANLPSFTHTVTVKRKK